MEEKTEISMAKNKASDLPTMVNPMRPQIKGNKGSKNP